MSLDELKSFLEENEKPELLGGRFAHLSKPAAHRIALLVSKAEIFPDRAVGQRKEQSERLAYNFQRRRLCCSALKLFL